MAGVHAGVSYVCRYQRQSSVPRVVKTIRYPRVLDGDPVFRPQSSQLVKRPSVSYAMYVGNVLVLDDLSVLRFHYDTRCHLSVRVSRDLQLEKGAVLLFTQLGVNGSRPVQALIALGRVQDKQRVMNRRVLYAVEQRAVGCEPGNVRCWMALYRRQR